MSEGGRGDAGLLERRARWLLRAYPAAYRADRGEEIIGTLLEAVPPGQDWPPPREAVALVAAGLRARRAANLRQGLAASLRQARSRHHHGCAACPGREGWSGRRAKPGARDAGHTAP